MKISIITATYNSAKTLEFCMDSVLNQTYENIEYIIVDGNSNDETLSIIKAKANKYKNIFWISEKDRGIYDALNKGINMANGDVIGFVHSDDFLANKNIIGKIVDVFKYKKVDGVYGNLHYVSADNIEAIVRNWKSQPFKGKLLKRGWMPAHPTLFLKREVYNLNGNFTLDYRISADYDFILRIFNKSSYRFFYLPETITKMRIGGSSNRNLKRLILKTKEDYHAARRNHIKWPIVTVGLKNVSKIPQFFLK